MASQGSADSSSLAARSSLREETEAQLAVYAAELHALSVREDKIKSAMRFLRRRLRRLDDEENVVKYGAEPGFKPGEDDDEKPLAEEKRGGQGLVVAPKSAAAAEMAAAPVAALAAPPVAKRRRASEALVCKACANMAAFGNQKGQAHLRTPPCLKPPRGMAAKGAGKAKPKEEDEEEDEQEKPSDGAKQEEKPSEEKDGDKDDEEKTQKPEVIEDGL